MKTNNINNIIETVIGNSNRERLNILYNDTTASPISGFLTSSDKLNFIKAKEIDLDILSLGFSAYFCNDYLEIDKGHATIINSMHVKNVIPFADPPYKMLKREDFVILEQKLRLSSKICFNNFIHSIWSQYFEVEKIDLAMPDFELNDSTERKSIIVISTSNTRQAKIIHEQITKVANDAGLILSFAKVSINEVLSILGQFKVAIVLDNSISCYAAMSAGCSVVCPIPFYDQIFTYTNSQELNAAIVEANKAFDSGESIKLAKKLKQENKFKTFDSQLYDYIINVTKEPFLL